ncbi:Uncharacterised protein [Tatumella ptyseos]|uniref:Uncharacterized protein n=1 Tax=Tatumella ptyseos TaxID=82987 RepID=A0A2X5PCP1_9GAMM|nr:Uncharacterised protein [Tatumella ptyseos]
MFLVLIAIGITGGLSADQRCPGARTRQRIAVDPA